MITYAGDTNYLLYGTDWPISNMKLIWQMFHQIVFAMM